MELIGFEKDNVLFRCKKTGVELSFDPEGTPALLIAEDGVSLPENYADYLEPFEVAARNTADRMAEEFFKNLMA